MNLLLVAVVHIIFIVYLSEIPIQNFAYGFEYKFETDTSPVTDKKENLLAISYEYKCTHYDCNYLSTMCIPKGTSDFYCDCKDGFKLKEGRTKETNKEDCEHKNACQFYNWKLDWDTAMKVCENKNKDLLCYSSKKEIVDITDAITLNDSKEAELQMWLSRKDCSRPNEPERCLSLYLEKSRENLWFFFQTDCTKKLPFACCNKGGKNRCEDATAICDTETSVCIPVGGTDFYCKCKDGFKPNHEDITKNKDACLKNCDCGKYSHGCKWNEQEIKVCDCFDGYVQYEGICSDCYCGNRSFSCSFDDKGNKICKCHSGYAQRNTSCTAKCKSNIDCLNGGICQYQGNGYFCNCKPRFEGDNCEINAACDSMSEMCDAIGAVCSYNEWLQKGFCECPPDRIYNRGLKRCVDICKPGSCVNGKCEIIDYHKECRCDDGYEGKDCDIRVIKIVDKTEWIIIIGILCALTFFVLITSICCLITHKFKRKE